MTVAVLAGAELVSAVGVTEEVPLFDNTVKSFVQDEELASGQNVFKRSGKDFVVEDYAVANESSYGVNKILFKGGKLQYVNAMPASDVPKEPEEYAPLPIEETDFTKFTGRYIKLGSMSITSGAKLTFKQGNVTHLIFKSIGGDFRYRLTEPLPSYHWGNEVYDGVVSSSTGIITGDYYIKINEFNGKYRNTSYYNSLYLSNVPDTITKPKTGDIFTHPATGMRYRLGELKGQYWDGLIPLDVTSYYAIIREIETFRPTIIYDEQLFVMYNANPALEYKSICIKTSSCSSNWGASGVLFRPNGTDYDVYIRSNTNDPVQTKTITTPNFEELIALDQISWGWTKIRPTASYAPLDGKKNTYVHATNTVTYRLKGVSTLVDGEQKSAGVFDTIAINGLISGNVLIKFFPDDGLGAIADVNVLPDCTRDKRALLSLTATTAIVKAERPFTGEVELTFDPVNYVRIGGIALGLSVDAGFTNVVFTNKFKDYSPFSKDQFGHILRVPVAKVNVYSGTVDVWMTDYSMTNRLIRSIGGETVILDGSDNVNNEILDDVDFFEATEVVGRIGLFELKTKLDKNKMAQMATYSFQIEEDI